jgi:hypothetical protein
MLRVRVRYEDEESRAALKKAGFRWNPQRKLWEGPDTPANRELLDRLGLIPEATLAPAADHELERHDKQAAELLGEYIYSFSREGRRVVGISWAGAKRLAQKYLPGLEVELVRVDTTFKRLEAQQIFISTHYIICLPSHSTLQKFIIMRIATDPNLPCCFHNPRPRHEQGCSAQKYLISDL